MRLVECHPKTWQATVRSEAQEVTNLRQHQCATDSVLEMVLVLHKISAAMHNALKCNL